MNLNSIASDHQLAIGPLRLFVSADQEFEGELFEDVIAYSPENDQRSPGGAITVLLSNRSAISFGRDHFSERSDAGLSIGREGRPRGTA